MSKALLVAAGVLAYILLCLGCTCLHWKEIESLAAGNPPADTIAAASPGAPLSGSASLSVTRRDGKVVLTGLVPTEEMKTAIVDRTRELYGVDGFVDELKVASPAGESDIAWVRTAKAALPWAETVGFALSDKQCTLTGEVPSEDVRIKTVDLARTTLGESWKVIDELRVSAGAATPEAAATPEPEKVTPSAAPTPGAASAANDTTADNLEAFKGIEFETGSAAITARGRALLDQAAKVMKATGDTRYEIGGHTDSRGADAANLNLSLRRAESVRAYLVGKGIEAARLSTKGYGEARPIVPNDTPANLSRNRRIEFTELK